MFFGIKSPQIFGPNQHQLDIVSQLYVFTPGTFLDTPSPNSTVTPMRPADFLPLPFSIDAEFDSS